VNNDIETIAAHMRIEQLAINGYLADSIEVHHVPPSPVDGQVKGAVFANMTETFATSEDIDREVLSIDIEGDEVVQRAIVRNQLDGSIVAHTGRFKVVDGLIVAVHSTYEPRETAEPPLRGAS